MKQIYLITFFFLLLTCFQIHTQEIVSIELQSTQTEAELEAEFGLPIALFIRYGIENYKVVYTTTDLAGQTVEVSGLLVLPDNPAQRFPLLCYQHGTVDGPDAVLSTPGNFEGSIARLFGGLGFVTLGPDLLGLGVHEGIHPYVHADSEASVAADMIRAVRAYGEDNGIYLNDQHFLTGYSQGGHSSMALQRGMEIDWSDEFTVTAGSHMSGPYDISGIMRDLVFSDEEYFFPSYIPNLVLSYQAAYGNLYNDLSDIFKPAYVNQIEQFANDEIGLFDLNDDLIDLLTLNEGVSLPKLLFLDDVIAEIENDPSHPMNVALADNDVYDWTPQAPTVMIYCTDDDQVPFENAIVAETKMMENGSITAEAIDIDGGEMLDHGDCVVPALTETLLNSFLPLQLIEDVNSTEEVSFDLPFEVFPNPVEDQLKIIGLPENGTFQLIDLNGKMMMQKSVSAGQQQVDVSQIPMGFYLMQIVGEKQIWQKRLVIK